VPVLSACGIRTGSLECTRKYANACTAPVPTDRTKHITDIAFGNLIPEFTVFE
jgi:hypothetical protein